ncbi:MAG: hypothetical protein JNK05_38115 [Myxococcales bacterium]|nr:hypothetical protein [Myxococcales bacterium]
MITRSASMTLFGLALAACGAQSVVPEGDANASDAALSDSPPPSDAATAALCGAPVLLFDANTDTVATMAFAPARHGYVSVVGTRAGAVFAQAYDGNWAPVGARLELPSQAPSNMYGRREPSVAFEEGRGAITYGASVHEVSISPALELSLVRSVVAEQDGTRHALLGAWPRTDDLGREHTTAITTDGSGWEAMGGRFARVAATTQSANFYNAAVQFPTTYNNYVAFDTIAQRDINNNVSIRTFTPGHGMMLLGVDRTERGTMIGAPVRVGDSLWRLHSQAREPSRGLVEEFALVQHDPESGDTRARVTISEAGLVTTGALAARAGSTSVSEALVAWTRAERATPFTQQIVAQWGPSGARTTLATHATSEQSAVVHGAWVASSGARAWVVYGIYAPYQPSTPTRRQLFAQCVAR